MTQLNVHPDILRQLTDRTVMPKGDFLQQSDEGRMRGFTIAKQLDARVLQDTLDAIKATVEQGGTLWDFKENFPELLAPYREAGREWHLELVFRQNVAQAQAVGAHQARQQTKSFLPFVEYHAGPNPRPSHAALDGKIFRVDDPFLLAHTPPWDFNCNCYLISRTAAQVATARIADQGRDLEEQQVVEGNTKLEMLRGRNQMPVAERIGTGGSLFPVDVREPALKGGEYSFRPDRLNQPVDLAGLDPEIRTRLIGELQTVGYRLSADESTMLPPGDASASKVQGSRFKVQKHVGHASASKCGLARSGGLPGGSEHVGRGSGRVGRPAPQIARIGRREAA